MHAIFRGQVAVNSALLRRATFSAVLIALVACCLFSAAPVRADLINVAGTGTGTIGFIDPTANPTQTIYTNGTENDHAGSVSAINDNTTATRIDDYPQTTNDYVGVTFSSPVNYVESVGLVMAMFVDGGWFGTTHPGIVAGSPLAAGDLAAPIVQITSDGTHWTNVAATSNYDSVMLGATIGGGANSNPVNSPLSTFTLDHPQSDVLGIRLLGNGGGYAGNGGFIGVSEMYVNVPEPSSVVLVVLGAVGLAIAARRRRKAQV